MSEIVPMNEYVLVKVEDKKTEGVYFGENKDKPKEGTILTVAKGAYEKAAEYATLQSSVLSAARRGYVDTIIEAEDTRKYVIGAFEMLYTKREDRPSKKHGTV